ncbi:hypothetical protein APE_0516.1 [Aeropyrum pernix K1]|uniref:UPF0113 protein APE_0516.1 n=1 Tax=Aeropyrum pernix (strain ATCC 700893 / DSM 11879 / JCM 9820 / NBRC 100138 / K1) TaxID=272557 RepID=Y516_AERPE|nr:PUA domain-containing protein [Aeropyrum pernix]Q9YER5.2 RecName: Full=UPF0113 protein APE_0516.1 [Aeropyrum pernix K1]BAA79481.2 hypothetical protein APE_0516.1 [Aeropyrum pernix K1]
MQGEEEGLSRYRLRPPTPREERLVEGFLRAIGFKVNPYAEGMTVLDPGGKFKEVFYLPWGLRRAVERLPLHYSAGLNLGSIGERGFRPSLHLARELAPLCGSPVKCIRLSPRGEKLFLYSRDVYGDNIASHTSGAALVVGSNGQPLGWGVGLSRDGLLIVKPLRDLGWYLRRGG